MILIISYPNEDHTLAVTGLLKEAGQSFVVLDFAELPASCEMTFEWTANKSPVWLLTRDNETIDLSTVSKVWWRRIRGFTVDSAITRPQERIFADSETAQAFYGALDSMDCQWINSRYSDEAAHHKPLQWTLAQKCGFKVPHTLVTSNPQQVKLFLAALDRRRAVYKPFIASIEDWRETRIVEPEDLERLETVRLAPVIFQEYIEGVDLRVTIVADKVFAAEIDVRETSYPFDMRMVIGEAKTAPIELPEIVKDKLLALMRRLGLIYGACDLRRTEKGDYYFLEVNPAGQWLFAERITGFPITQAVADYLMSTTRS